MKRSMSPKDWYLTGLNFLDSRRYQEALSAFEEAIALDDSADAWVGKGMTLRELARSEEALNAFDQSLRARPGYPRAWWQRGISLHDLGRLPEALVAYNNALRGHFGEDFPEDFRTAIRAERDQILYELAHAMLEAGRFSEALAAYDQAVAVDPNDPRALLGKSVCMSQLGRHSEAKDTLLSAWSALETRPDDKLRQIIRDGLQSYGTDPLGREA